MVSVAPPAELSGLIYGYIDYTERTASFTTRRELPNAKAVLIVNLAEQVSIMGGDSGRITLDAGEAFVAGPHLRPALSQSGGAQEGAGMGSCD
jgi:hypothetical protein